MKYSLVIVAAALVAAAPVPVVAQAASFTLVNNTDVNFTGLMVRRYGSQQWLPLVVKPLPVAQSGGSGAVDFSDPECAFDLQATLPSGQVVVWPRVNLCEATVVTLNRSANGQLWVDYR
jgi:hypothetical protein